MTESPPSRVPTGDSAATVLLVDDDDDWRIALSRWLEGERLRVVALARGEWVVSTIRRDYLKGFSLCAGSSSAIRSIASA